ncbi:MAG: hypothetical protein ABEJ83_05560 [Candidatus Nanohaloarchaea archaeon]
MRVEKLLKRLRTEFLKVNFLQACLDTIIIFLSLNLILFLLSLRITPAFQNEFVLLAIALAIFPIDFLMRSKKYRLELYEEKNPELKEILRTARDNIDKNNIVSQALFDELLDRSRSVTSESIIPSRRIIQKILVIGAISFLTVLSGLVDFQVSRQQQNIIPDLNELKQQITGGGNQSFQLNDAEAILGEKKDIKLSEKIVNYNITGQGQKEESAGRNQQKNLQKLSLTSSNPAITENLELAKQYSLALKNME